ncbi:MAG TPA: penicillin-binding protein activator [Pseudobdellovibrionaceae bacterium]|nr:penicillin-binding protein activator [Pseudobdellovibrionaceae bacterium]
MKTLCLVLTVLFAVSCSTSRARKTPDRHAGRPLLRQAPTGRHSVPLPAQPVLTRALPSEAERAVSYERNGEYLNAIREYHRLSTVSENAASRESYRIKSLDLLETRLDESELKSVAGDSDFGTLRGYAYYQLGSIYLDRRETDSARRAYSTVQSYIPGTEIALRATDLVSQLDSIRYVDSKTIGVVLPLSGKNAAIGQRALRGIEMGLGLDDGSSPYKLAVADSEGNPDVARRAVERLVKEDNVIGIIGSLLSRTAPAVASKADELGVPTIALSQKSGITEIGPTVFRNSLTSEMQVRQIVRTAIDDMNLRRFAILYPNDPYGIEYANYFWDEVLARGGQVTAVQTYNPKDTDFRAVTQRLVGTWYVEARQDEFRLLSKEKGQSQSNRRSARQNKNAEDLLPAIVDFDAIFIPDSAKMLSQMAAFLSYAGVRNVKLLGTNLWNSPSIAKRAGNFSDKLVFVDSPVVDSSGGSSKFVSDYKSLFGENPTGIEVQAYDSALLIRSLIGQGASTREQLTRRLTDLRSFPGATGPLFMSSAREVRRPLTSFVTDAAGNIAPYRVNR